MATYLETRMENDLQQIREQMVLQVKAVTAATERAVKAVNENNNDLAHQIVLEDYPINRRMRAIDKLCHRFIAIHLPSAQPLRLLSSIIRANVEVERMGDNVVTIAREAVQLTKPVEGVVATELAFISEHVLMMLRQASHAFEELSAELAEAPMAMADQLQHDMEAIYNELIKNKEKDKIKNVLIIFIIFNQLKRIADLTKNLCEHTIFADTGATKKSRPRNITFLDRNGSLLAPMALAIADHNFADKGQYTFASIKPAASLSVKLSSYLNERGMESIDTKAEKVASFAKHDIDDQDVLVCLEGTIDDYIKKVPFHTSVLSWQLDSEESPENLYRELAARVGDLINLLHGAEE